MTKPHLVGAADPISPAIAAAAERGATPAHPTAPMIGGQIRVSSGRVVLVQLPADFSDVELVDFIAEVSTNLRAALAANRAKPAATSGLIVPGGRPLLVPAR